ncbi:SH3 domain-containing protein [Trichoderma austrokoningii]
MSSGHSINNSSHFSSSPLVALFVLVFFGALILKQTAATTFKVTVESVHHQASSPHQPATMDRQTIMETNRSLRNIKNELESLLEKGVINESAFDTIHAALPAETPLRGAAAGSAGHSASQTPAPAAALVQTLQDLKVKQGPSSAPPSYDETPAPGVPTRPPAPGRRILAYARALYRYDASDARDLGLREDDMIDVYEYMNKDWWMGRNQRTGLEGIFPASYVWVDINSGYPARSGPPAQQNPYNASVPPMAIAEGGQPLQQQGGDGNSKAGEYGKKFGKKLGNAAIFGAGASIGSNIVNSIF